MRMFDVTIEFLDGTTETVKSANELRIFPNGVLNIWRDRPHSGGQDHLGSWPLTAIKRWTRSDQ